MAAAFIGAKDGDRLTDIGRFLCQNDPSLWSVTGCGAVAQQGERLVRNEEVRGSIPLGSTTAAVTP